MGSVKLVICDLDGTLIDTESLVLEVARGVLAQHGRALTPEALAASAGRRPLEAWQATVDALGLTEASAQQLYDESEALLKERWQSAQLMPGAGRLLFHLHHCGVRVGLATSTPRATMERKLSAPAAQGLRGIFQVTHCGDEVRHGKPAPDCFRAAAAKLGAAPEDCLVIEDAPSGVQAAAAAGMRVVVVPSLPDRDAYPPAHPNAASGCVEVLPSLYDFHPERYGLPPFADTLAHGVVPVEPPWRLKGTVVKGFGRGSKELGVPTANLDSESLQGTLAEMVTGIFSAWASVGPARPDGSLTPVYECAMSIGWNPFYKNEKKTAEPWLLHDFDADFYGEELRLVVVGYIRPERNFDSLEALVARIHEDAAATHEALRSPRLSAAAADPLLQPQRIAVLAPP
ncbi:hypothetical protein WJX81_001891 [Elliptochloris bilobata]|uniref:riboflavin kinase n=1 Tax=Elliptochloris bilobata TaxID=381761 RepID=A0AAW1RTG1_9CHLO